jgi:hypothetical protein
MDNDSRSPQAVAVPGEFFPAAAAGAGALAGALGVRRQSKTGEIHGLDVWSFRERLSAIRRLQRAWTLNPRSPIK